jgi:hypothetical protein
MAFRRIAYFISGHGFGHAARASAVMAAAADRDAAFHFEIFSDVPLWFFKDSLRANWRLHRLKVDIGLVQRSPFEVDLQKTADLLRACLPYRDRLLSELAQRLRVLKCRAVVCDIAPLGIAAARKAALPILLVENFTWDYIYNGYPALLSSCTPQIDYLAQLFASAEHHVQPQPFCVRYAGAVSANPVARRRQLPVEEVRRRLRLPPEASMVLVTTGGIPLDYKFLGRLESLPGVRFVLPGAARGPTRRGSLILLPHRSGFHHPDLVSASDAVIGKLGYSTLAETYLAGVPLAYIPRMSSPENRSLESFATTRLKTVSIEPREFIEGTWVSRVNEILALSRSVPPTANGDVQVADLLVKLAGG